MSGHNDHLQSARYAVEHAHSISNPDTAMISAQCAIAHALIALVERLDKLTSTDALDETRGAIRIEPGI